MNENNFIVISKLTNETHLTATKQRSQVIR